MEYDGQYTYLTSVDGIRQRIDTNDFNAVQGMQGPYVHHIYTLDSTKFDAYYFNTCWTAYIKTAHDTVLFCAYQSKPICVSPAVSRLIMAKYLGR